MNITKIRRETPGVTNHVHFNNAGSSLPPFPVLNRVISHLELEALVGGYEAFDMVQDEISEFYIWAARLIHAKNPLEIAFTQSATEAWFRIFSSITLLPRDRVIIFQNEYASIYLALLHQQKIHGFSIDIIPLNAQGDIDLELLSRRMNSDVKMVLLGHMPTQSGTLSPAEEIGSIVKKYDTIYVLDATQTIGQYPVDVEKIGCDALCATGRKFLRAPRGTGFLYVKETLWNRLVPNLIDLEGAALIGSQAYKLADGCKRFESWERSIALELGIKEALKYACDIGIDEIWRRGQDLATKMRQGLLGIKGVLLCDPGSKLGNIITFVKDGISCSKIINTLASQGICINLSRKAYAWLDFEQRGLNEVCRASPHYYNNEDEVDKFLQAINDI